MPDGPPYEGLRAGVAPIGADEGVRSALARVVGNAVQLLGVPSSVSVTLIEHDDRPATVAASDERASALDDAQYADGDGPCLSAARTGSVVRVDKLAARTMWPTLQAAAPRHDVHSSLSAPLVLSGRAAGSLNAYSPQPAGFGTTEERIMVTLAAQASVIAVNAQAYWAAFDGTRNLTVALQTRSVIDLARGVLIAQHGISADDAFSHLVAAADRSGRPVHAVAQEVVAHAEPGGSGDGDES